MEVNKFLTETGLGNYLKAHLSISFQVGFLPYMRIPVLYIFPQSHTEKTNPAINKAIESPSCQYGTVPGTPNGIRAIIIIGELKGMILPHTANAESGLATAVVIMINDKIMGMVIGSIRDCASCGSSFTTLPTAAKRDA